MTTETLAEFLTEKLRLSSSRELAAATGITHTTIQRMARGPLKNVPEIETLQRLGRAFNLPLWRVMEMAGVDLELPDQFDTDMRRVLSLAKQQHSFGEVVSQLTTASQRDLEAVRHYLHISGVQNRVYEVVYTLRREMPHLAQAVLRVGQELGIPMQNQHVYVGERLRPSPEGRNVAEVKVDGKYLIDLLGWTAQIEWGYAGQGPSTLARAIFAYEFQEAYRSRFYGYAGYFGSDLITRLPHNVGGQEWTMHSREIHLWVTLAALAKLIPDEQPLPIDDDEDEADS